MIGIGRTDARNAARMGKGLGALGLVMPQCNIAM